MNKNERLSLAGQFDTILKEVRLYCRELLKTKPLQLPTKELLISRTRQHWGPRVKRLLKVIAVPIAALLLLAWGHIFGNLFVLHPMQAITIIFLSAIVPSATCYIWYGDENKSDDFGWFTLLLFILFLWAISVLSWAGSVFIFDMIVPFAFPPDPATLTRAEACDMLNLVNGYGGRDVFFYDKGVCWWENWRGQLVNVDNISRGFDLSYWKTEKY